MNAMKICNQIVINQHVFMEQLKPTIKLSRSTMPLHASSALVFSFTERLNFPVICSRLTGQKTPEEVLNITVNPCEV